MGDDPGHLSDRHFRSVADLVQHHAGIQLPPAKRTMVEGRLRKRMRALDLPTLEAYGHHCSRRAIADEFPHLVDCVTTNKTDFFREPAHFDLLRTTIVPRLAARGRPAAAQGLERGGFERGGGLYAGDGPAGHGRRPVPLCHPRDDISSEVLDRARTAIYPEEMLEAVPPDLRRRYVMVARDPARREGADRARAARRVRFQRLNLMDESYPIDGTSISSSAATC